MLKLRKDPLYMPNFESEGRLLPVVVQVRYFSFMEDLRVLRPHMDDAK